MAYLRSPHTGRPHRSAADKRAIAASAHIEAKFPSVAKLLNRMRKPNGDPKGLSTLLDLALAEIQASDGIEHPAYLGSSAEEQILLHAARLQQLFESLRIHELLNGAVQTRLNLIKTEIKRAEDGILEAAAYRETTEQYMLDLARMLAAAGVTARSARNLNSATVDRIAQAIRAAPEADADRSREVATNLEETLWQTQRQWSEVLVKSDYIFKVLKEGDKELGTHPPSQTEVLSCGLPPFVDAEQFDYTIPQKLRLIDGPEKKIRIIVKSCNNWLHNSLFPKENKNVIDLRNLTWGFLFSLKYGFAREIRDYGKVVIASPFVKGELLLAERKMLP